MSGHGIFRCGLVLAGFVLGASSAAEARIPQAQPAMRAVPDILGGVANLPAVPVLGDAGTSKIISLNFGPLHFQEIMKSAPKSCRS